MIPLVVAGVVSCLNLDIHMRALSKAKLSEAEMHHKNIDLRNANEELAKLNEEILKTSKIETLGVFAGGIAHDLNNLLTAVLGNISLARFMNSDTEIDSALHSAEEASLKTRDLACRLLTFTKGGDPVKEITLLNELVAETTEFALSGSGIDYEIDIPDGLWRVCVDKTQISQVIHNIILNSRQAMQDNGSIIIRAENQKWNGSDSRVSQCSCVRLSIRDNGPGISEEILGNVFDPFFTTKSNGSGLGLAIVYSVIKKHDGNVSVISEKGKGCEFIIYLPAITDKLVRFETKASPGEFNSSGKILVVDDDRDIVNVLQNMLNQLGFDVDSVFCGEDSLSIYRNAQSSGHRYDCVIMDLTMRGGLDGDETVRLLKDHDPDVKVIVSSGYSNDPIMANFREYGFEESLQKPYRIEDLKSAISRVLV